MGKCKSNRKIVPGHRQNAARFWQLKIDESTGQFDACLECDTALGEAIRFESTGGAE
jgi:hypothetical protein